MGTRPGSVFWHLVAGRAGPTGRHPRPIRVPYDISRRWKGCSTRSERAWVSETPNPASLRLVERPTFRARAPIRSTRIESKATKQASKGAGVRAFYWLGRGIIVSGQEVSGKVTYDAGVAKMEYRARAPGARPGRTPPGRARAPRRSALPAPPGPRPRPRARCPPARAPGAGLRLGAPRDGPLVECTSTLWNFM